MEDVMNNRDLRSVIWKFLRKKPKVSCRHCNKTLIWDRERVEHYFEVFIGAETYSFCYMCWDKVPNTGCTIH